MGWADPAGDSAPTGEAGLEWPRPTGAGHDHPGDGAEVQGPGRRGSLGPQADDRCFHRGGSASLESGFTLPTGVGGQGDARRSRGLAGGWTPGGLARRGRHPRGRKNRRDLCGFGAVDRGVGFGADRSAAGGSVSPAPGNPKRVRVPRREGEPAGRPETAFGSERGTQRADRAVGGGGGELAAPTGGFGDFFPGGVAGGGGFLANRKSGGEFGKSGAAGGFQYFARSSRGSATFRKAQGGGGRTGLAPMGGAGAGTGGGGSNSG